MGGTYDPTTGQMVWTMHVPLADQLAHYRSHPPRAIRELRAMPVDVDFRFDGHGEPVDVAFELACPCGGTRFDVTCGLDEDDEPAPPIELECGACAASYKIFDDNEHGYDAELNSVERQAPELIVDLDPADIDLTPELVVRFEFPSDHLGDPQYAGREHDLFSWFTLLARDPETKQLEFLFDAECA